MSAVVLRGDARAIPLPDASVDLIVTSPPYFGLRDYRDGGKSMAGQIGSEETPAEYIANLLDCTQEWCRVLKSSGSIFINLGDAYYSGKGSPTQADRKSAGRRGWVRPLDRSGLGFRQKSLLGLPWRYALACADELGLILRRDIIWSKPSGLPESVTDRCGTRHEYLFHLVKQRRYYAAVDEIREPHSDVSIKRAASHRANPGRRDAVIYSGQNGQTLDLAQMNHPLGKLPGSVWEITTQPLTAPEDLGVDHFAAFPFELPRRCILGWSPPGICLECSEGRRPVAVAEGSSYYAAAGKTGRDVVPLDQKPPGCGGNTRKANGTVPSFPLRQRIIIGYACACTPCTDHPGTGQPSGPYGRHADAVATGTYENVGAGWGGRGGLGDRPRVGPWREYHLDGWSPPPARPAVVLDPFGGTGSTALVANVLGRTGISLDLSADYCRLAAWRTTDPGERARARGLPKPPPVPDGQGALFDASEAS